MNFIDVMFKCQHVLTCCVGSIKYRFMQHTNFDIYLMLSYAVLLISSNKSNKVSKINAWLLLVSCQVNMNVCGEFLSLEVPGLSEGRPSLLLGDRVVASLSGLLQVIAMTFDVQSAIFLFLQIKFFFPIFSRKFIGGT